MNNDKRKSLYDISWQVDEPTYRENSALSYSLLAKYERTGFNGLSSLFDKIESPSLTFGSAVDSIITGGLEEFNDRFIVAEFPSISDNLIQITKVLFTRYKDTYRNITDIPDSILAEVGKECGFYANDKYANYRIKLIKEGCVDYYRLLFISEGKTILDTQTHSEVMAAVEALKTNRATEFYFKEDNPFNTDIERLYQLKFKGEFEGLPYRCMADLIIVNHKEKWVLPIDLKTSGKPEWDFHKSFVDWNYDIQARLYWAIIKQNMDNDEYFKDFELLDYKFIVINKKTLTPLVWDYPSTRAIGTLTFGKDNQISFRHPIKIGHELFNYLNGIYKTPIGIKETEPNSLYEWLNNL